MSETEIMEPRVSTLELDEETRARVAEELGLTGGANALPAEIKFVAVDPKEAVSDDDDVGGFATLGAALQTHNLFSNQYITPSLNFDSLYRRGYLGGNAFHIALRV
jgi:hypothetical protein